jgi:tripartite-type tricarboxylate transporter receptor subunit TctC
MIRTLKPALKLGLSFVLFLSLLVTGCSTKSSEQPKGEKAEQKAEQKVEPKAEQKKADYPAKDITFIVGTNPGGGYDEWARGIAPYIQKHLPNKVNMIVENVAGANGRIAAVRLMQAKPDGYQFNIINSGLASSQALGGVDFDMTKFSWLGTLTEESSVLFVSKKSNIKTVKDFFDRSKPVLFASSGFGGLGDNNWLLFSKTLGFKWSHVNHMRYQRDCFKFNTWRY